MLVAPIPEREFDLYAQSLPEGPNFDPYVVVSGWKCDNGCSVAAICSITTPGTLASVYSDGGLIITSS
jgi:hypothetical protein